MSASSVVTAFVREQSAPVWALQLGMFVNFFGNGLVAPFLVLYLHLARGLPLPWAAAAIASGGLTAVASGLVAGWSADRFSPKWTLVFAMTCNALAYGLYLAVSEGWHALAVAMLVGVGTGMYGPTQQSLTAALVPPERRHRVFTLNRMFALTGLGLGGIAGGLIAAAGRRSDYETLLVLDVLTFLAFAGVLSLLPASPPRPKATVSSGYREVLTDRSLLGVALVNVALVSAALAPMLVLMPAYARLHGGVGLDTIGFIYAANTAAVLIAQIPITRFGEGRRRMPYLAVGIALWVLSWAAMFIAVEPLRPWAALLIGAAVVVYAMGECMYSAVVVPTVAAIAPDQLRGRYLAVLGLSWQSGFLIGPAVGGVLVASGPLGLPLVAGTVCAAALIAALALDRRLPLEHRHTPRVAPTLAQPPGVLRLAKGGRRMRWITREHPRVDRVACPWLIERSVDRDAEFIYVPADRVMSEAERLGATPYDVPGVELGHHGSECSFDAFVQKYRLGRDPALALMARVVRGADTEDKDLTPESRGIEALLDGVRALHYPDDQRQREASRIVLDLLYAYCEQKVRTD